MAKWISKAIKHPGALHRELGISENKSIPKSKLAHAAAEGGVIGRRARLAETLRKFNRKKMRGA